MSIPAIGTTLTTPAATSSEQSCWECITTTICGLFHRIKEFFLSHCGYSTPAQTIPTVTTTPTATTQISTPQVSTSQTSAATTTRMANFEQHTSYYVLNSISRRATFADKEEWVSQLRQAFEALYTRFEGRFVTRLETLSPRGPFDEGWITISTLHQEHVDEQLQIITRLNLSYLTEDNVLITTDSSNGSRGIKISINC